MRIVSLCLVASLVFGMQFALAADESAVDYITQRYADAPAPGAQASFSPRIQALWTACDLMEVASGDPCMDFNIWVNAQDWEIKDLKIEQIKADDKSAKVMAHFSNMDRKESISFDLLREPQGWVVDEISTGCDTLSNVLQGKPSTAC